MSTQGDDFLDGCEVDFADPATVTSEEQATAILLFGDLPWDGEAIDPATGQTVPTIEPALVAERMAALAELNE